VKDIATIYVKELRDGLDESLIPVFPPNTIVAVGSVGRVRDGRFVPHGSLQEMGAKLAIVPQGVAADMTFTTQGKVQLGPTVRIPAPDGSDLASATLSFTGDRSVAATFAKVTSERAVLAEFDRVLYEQLVAGNLSADDVVAWSVSVAESGTVVVAAKGGASVDLRAPIPGDVGFDTMALGVTFANDKNTSFRVSSAPLYASVRLRRVTPTARQPVGDVFGLEPPSGSFADVVVDDLLQS
jgi:hypothetical protein